MLFVTIIVLLAPSGNCDQVGLTESRTPELEIDFVFRQCQSLELILCLDGVKHKN